MHRWWPLAALFLLVACQKSAGLAPSSEKRQDRGPIGAMGPSGLHGLAPGAKPAPLPVCRSEGREPLEAARAFYDSQRFEEALSCAAQATALHPDDPRGHSERGAALSALGSLDEARLAYARALALDPDNLDALLGAAHLYAVGLPSTRERDELASLYSERGLVLAEHDRERELMARFALLSAMAFNDLGQARDALDRADLVLRLEGQNPEARYERAVALFELCRFREAKAAFTSMLSDAQRSAHAHHHLGLLLEREGKWKQAEQHFGRARQLDPEDFPEPQLISEVEFEAEIQKAVAALPEDMRNDLAGVPIRAEEIPRDDDLLSGDPPLSPAILGLFRGPPLKDRCAGELFPGMSRSESCRSVALYRRNLARAVKSKQELIEQIRVTLLHEIGHLRGEDDFELAARGLE
jgi:tetratricopeptide (TPR) repeat protein